MATQSQRITRIAVISAMYAILTLIVAPISFGPVQFRVSEVLKVIVLLDPIYALSIGLGSAIANIGSPFGALDIIYMPITDIAGGYLAHYLFRAIRKRWILPPLALYAITTGTAVGVMLSIIGMGEWYWLALPVIASELIILLIGGPIVWRGVRWVNQR